MKVVPAVPGRCVAAAKIEKRCHEKLVALDSSPICKALAGGWAALNNDAYWSCYFAYMSLSVPAAIWEIWGEILPVLT